jgi:hypothetical protein
MRADGRERATRDSLQYAQRTLLLLLVARGRAQARSTLGATNALPGAPCSDRARWRRFRSPDTRGQRDSP